MVGGLNNKRARSLPQIAEQPNGQRKAGCLGGKGPSAAIYQPSRISFMQQTISSIIALILFHTYELFLERNYLNKISDKKKTISFPKKYPHTLFMLE